MPFVEFWPCCPRSAAPRSQLVSASASVLTGGVVVYVVGRLFIA